MKLKDALLLLLVITLGATIANLVALKIAADQAQSALANLSNTSAGGLLNLFARK